MWMDQQTVGYISKIQNVFGHTLNMLQTLEEKSECMCMYPSYIPAQLPTAIE